MTQDLTNVQFPMLHSQPKWMSDCRYASWSSSDDFVASSFHAARRVTRIDDKRRVIHNPLIIEVGVVGRDDSDVLVFENLLGE